MKRLMSGTFAGRKARGKLFQGMPHTGSGRKCQSWREKKKRRDTRVDRRQQRGKNGSWAEADKMVEMWGSF